MTSGRSTSMDVIELLRRLALNDEAAVRLVVGAACPVSGTPVALDTKAATLVRLGALLSLGAATASCRVTVERARSAGASDEEIVAVLVAVAPVVGAAGVVDAAPRLALAIDHDVDALED